MKRAGLLALALLFAAGHAWAQPAPFKHIIIVIQENRTPDNLFGSNPNFEPGVDIGKAVRISTGGKQALAALPLDSCYDVNHAHADWEAAYTKGFDQETTHIDRMPCTLPDHPEYAYVDNSTGTVQPYFDIALTNGFANRMFQTNQGPSFPAHQFLFGGTSAPAPSSPLFAAENPDPTNESGCGSVKQTTVALIDPYGKEKQSYRMAPCFEHRVLPDLLDEAATPITWRYYAEGPNGLWTAPNAIRHICGPSMTVTPIDDNDCAGADWLADVVPNNSSQVMADIMGCNLAAVSWVTPTAAESDHAGLNKGTGPAWVAQIVDLVGKTVCGSESYWNDTAIFVTWDDWGGWADHVQPLSIVKPLAWGAGYTYGFRVPLLVVSAYTMPKQVNNDSFDFGSILAFVEHNFGLGFIGTGQTKYDFYADYQAAQPGRGDLSVFFGLTAPKTFVPIATASTPAEFIHAPRSTIPPDED